MTEESGKKGEWKKGERELHTAINIKNVYMPQVYL